MTCTAVAHLGMDVMANPHNSKVVRPKGQRYPGSGRKKGTPNKISVDAKVLVGQLVSSADYQARLRRDFELRRVHPAIESMLWAYHIGRPRQDVAVTATVDVNARIEEERRVFASLEVADLERLAVESQQLVDRAKALARLRSQPPDPQDVVVGADLQKVSEKTLGFLAGSDNGSSVNHSQKVDTDDGTPTDGDT